MESNQWKYTLQLEGLDHSKMQKEGDTMAPTSIQEHKHFNTAPEALACLLNYEVAHFVPHIYVESSVNRPINKAIIVDHTTEQSITEIFAVSFEESVDGPPAGIYLYFPNYDTRTLQDCLGFDLSTFSDIDSGAPFIRIARLKYDDTFFVIPEASIAELRNHLLQAISDKWPFVLSRTDCIPSKMSELLPDKITHHFHYSNGKSALLALLTTIPEQLDHYLFRQQSQTLIDDIRLTNPVGIEIARLHAVTDDTFPIKLHPHGIFLETPLGASSFEELHQVNLSDFHQPEENYYQLYNYADDYSHFVPTQAWETTLNQLRESMPPAIDNSFYLKLTWQPAPPQHKQFPEQQLQGFSTIDKAFDALMALPVTDFNPDHQPFIERATIYRCSPGVEIMSRFHIPHLDYLPSDVYVSIKHEHISIETLRTIQHILSPIEQVSSTHNLLCRSKEMLPSSEHTVKRRKMQNYLSATNDASRLRSSANL